MTSLPFGLRDIKIATLEADGTPGTMIDLPNAQTMGFAENEDYTELRGDDKVVAKRGNGVTIDWSMDSGGIALEAYVAMNGGTLLVSGVTPNVVKKYTKKSTDARPDFWAEGQAMSESGGDFHYVLERAKADGGVEGELSDGEFWVSSASGTAIGRADNDDLYSFVDNETVTAIVQPT